MGGVGDVDAAHALVHDVDPVRPAGGSESLAGFDGPPSPVAVGGLLGFADLGIQRKVSVGSAADPLEDEAEANAAAVVAFLRGGGGGAAAVPPDAPADNPDADKAEAHRHHVACEHAPKISRHAGTPAAPRAGIGTAGGDLDADVERTLSLTRGTGTALPAPARQAMETAMGFDFSAVRVHSGPSATQLSRSMNADAFALGPDIYFRDGLPDVTTPGGAHLLAHELTHTVQQGHATPADDRDGAAQRTIRRNGKGQPSTPAPAPSSAPPHAVAATPTTGPTAASTPTATASTAPTANVHKQSISPPTIKDAFVEIGRKVDTIVPGDGDQAKLEVTIRLPLPIPDTVFVITVNLSAERKKGVKIAGSLAFGLGFKAIFMEAYIEAGWALSATGADAAAAAELLDYGLYRQVNDLFEDAATAMWGGNGKGPITTARQAREWADGVEKRDMTDENYRVDAGTIVHGRADAQLGKDKSASAQVDATRADGTRYGGAGKGEKPEHDGKHVRVYEGELKYEFNPDKHPFSLDAKLKAEYVEEALRSMEITTAVGLDLDALKAMSSEAANSLLTKIMVKAKELAGTAGPGTNADRRTGAGISAAETLIPEKSIHDALEEHFKKIREEQAAKAKRAAVAAYKDEHAGQMKKKVIDTKANAAGRKAAGTEMARKAPVEAKHEVELEFEFALEYEPSGQLKKFSVDVSLFEVHSVEWDVGAIGGTSGLIEQKSRIAEGEAQLGGSEHADAAPKHAPAPAAQEVAPASVDGDVDARLKKIFTNGLTTADLADPAHGHADAQHVSDQQAHYVNRVKTQGKKVASGFASVAGMDQAVLATLRLNVKKLEAFAANTIKAQTQVTGPLPAGVAVLGVKKDVGPQGWVALSPAEMKTVTILLAKATGRPTVITVYLEP